MFWLLQKLQETMTRMVLMVTQWPRERSQPWWQSILRMTIGTGGRDWGGTSDKKIGRRWQKGNCLLCFIASHSTNSLPVVFNLILRPVFRCLRSFYHRFSRWLFVAVFCLTAFCPICLISGSMMYIWQGKSILLMFSFNLLLVHSSSSACSNKATTDLYHRMVEKLNEAMRLTIVKQDVSTISWSRPSFEPI